MVTLYKRATPIQAQILRIIEGAVLNTYDAHNKERDHSEARSIAKRATGTLTAQMQCVLATPRVSSKADVAEPSGCHTALEADLAKPRVKKRRIRDGVSKRRSAQLCKRPPLLSLIKQLSKDMTYLRYADKARYEERIHVLRMIDKLRIEYGEK